MIKTYRTVIILLSAATCSQAATLTIENIEHYQDNFTPPSGNIKISGDTDVSTNGTLIEAVNFGNQATGSTIVNGVAFQNIASTGDQEAKCNIIKVAGGPQTALTDLGTDAEPFSGLSENYQALLGAGTTRTADNPSNYLVFDKLTAGKKYEVQIWFNNSAINHFDYLKTRVFLTTGKKDEDRLIYRKDGDWVSGAPQVSVNHSAMEGDAGSHLIGTFTADDKDLVLKWNGQLINAAQIRSIPDEETK